MNPKNEAPKRKWYLSITKEVHSTYDMFKTKETDLKNYSFIKHKSPQTWSPFLVTKNERKKTGCHSILRLPWLAAKL